jgi:hypothetical protein
MKFVLKYLEIHLNISNLTFIISSRFLYIGLGGLSSKTIHNLVRVFILKILNLEEGPKFEENIVIRKCFEMNHVLCK